MNELLALLAEPFAYGYMVRAVLLAAAVGGVCAFLSAYLVLKGYSLIGDALAHAVVPGVAAAYALGLPFSLGAFFAGVLAALAVFWIQSLSRLKEDAVIGFIFTSFFALGLFIVSLRPASVNVQEIIFGNILAVSDADMIQVGAVMGASVLLLLLFWKDLLLVFFDETHAKSVGLSPKARQALFFALLSACVVAALQTVGAVLVMAVLVTPGATAYQLTDRFGRMAALSVCIGVSTCALGVYLSYYLNGVAGGVIVCLQTLLFLLALLFSPKFGLLRRGAPGRKKQAAPF